MGRSSERIAPPPNLDRHGCPCDDPRSPALLVRHPAFPQESTADQFFDEEQFECYRALGYLMTKRAFAAGA